VKPVAQKQTLEDSPRSDTGALSFTGKGVQALSFPRGKG